MIRPITATAAVLAALVGPAVAQTAPPLDVVTELDPATGENRFRSVLVGRGGEPRAHTPDEWIRPELVGYAQAASPIVVALGVPAGPGVPITRGVANRDGLPSEPVPGAERAGLVTDDLVNSMLLNIADDMDGMTLRFPDGGLVNGPGPELLIVEASLPAGRVSGGCPGVPAPGADPMVVSLPGGEGVTVPAESFIDFGPAGPQLNHGTDEMAEASFRIESVERLALLDMRPLATIDYFKAYATAFDLSDLGLAEGDVAETVVLRSTGEMVETDDGPRLCWTADPILVVGLH